MRSLQLILATFSLACIISRATFALTLHCKFDDYLYEGNYKCEVENLSITARNEIVSEVSGTHISARRTNADVIILSIEDQTAHYLPRDLARFFPNLMYLTINKSGLREITKNDLRDFQSYATSPCAVTILKIFRAICSRTIWSLRMSDFQPTRSRRLGAIFSNRPAAWSPSICCATSASASKRTVVRRSRK